MASQRGFGPPTCGLGNRYSVQLSYWDIWNWWLSCGYQLRCLSNGRLASPFPQEIPFHLGNSHWCRRTSFTHRPGPNTWVSSHWNLAGCTGVEPVSLDRQSKILPMNEHPILKSKTPNLVSHSPPTVLWFRKPLGRYSTFPPKPCPLRSANREPVARHTIVPSNFWHAKGVAHDPPQIKSNPNVKEQSNGIDNYTTHQAQCKVVSDVGFEPTTFSMSRRRA